MRQSIVDRGQGPPLVLVPGIQGHWQWMRPTIEALSAAFRVVSYSLAGERGSTRKMDRGATFDLLADQLGEIIEDRGLERPILCGVSYGGLVVVHYAARNPDRCSALVLVSAPSPRWKPDARIARYARSPRAFAPLFAAQAFRRLLDELAVTYADRRTRLRFMSRHVPTLTLRPLSPTRASRRMALVEPVDIAADCGRLDMPVLLVTGEPHLDRVVPVSDTLEYRSFITQAQARIIERTGHLGAITRARRFAEIVREFVVDNGVPSGGSVRIGSNHRPRAHGAPPPRRTG